MLLIFVIDSVTTIIFYITWDFSYKFVKKICKKGLSFMSFFQRILIGR